MQNRVNRVGGRFDVSVGTMLDPLTRRLLRGAGTVPASSGRGPVVLMYHSIVSKRSADHDEWTISRAMFERHLRLLSSEGWHTACVSDLRHPKALPQKTVAITFDDGYADNYENGFALLQEAAMRATWFVVTNEIGGRSVWVEHDAGVKPLLTPAQLKEMAAAGMEIGGHTRSHPRLSRLDPLEMESEILGGKQDLEGILGKQVSSFAYPFGDFNAASVDAVRKAGYEIACTARPGWLGSDSNPLLVRRVSVFPKDGPGVLARKLVFADNAVGWVRMLVYARDRLAFRLRRAAGGRKAFQKP